MANEIQNQDFQNLGLVSPMTPDPTELKVEGVTEIKLPIQIVFYPGTSNGSSNEDSFVF